MQTGVAGSDILHEPSYLASRSHGDVVNMFLIMQLFLVLNHQLFFRIPGGKGLFLGPRPSFANPPGLDLRALWPDPR